MVMIFKFVAGAAIMGAFYHLTLIGMLDPQVFVNTGTAVLVGIGVIAAGK